MPDAARTTDSTSHDIKVLKIVLGLSVSLLSAEHIFSATLSSPWTTGKLAKTKADHKAFWQLFAEAAVVSIAFSITVGLLLGDPMAFVASLLGTILFLAWIYWDYTRALDGSLYGDGDAAPGTGVIPRAG